MSPLVMARLIGMVGGLGVLATIAVALQGWLLPLEPSAVIRHAGLGLVALLLALFPQAWFSLFAMFQARSLVAPSAADGSSNRDRFRQSLRRSALVMSSAAATAVGTSAIAFVSGTLAYTRDVPPLLHGGLALVAIASQAVSLFVALRVASETEELLRAIESESG